MTIKITDEMLDAYDAAILNHSPCADHTCDCGQKFKTTGDWHDHKISTALAAAAPHLRAGIAEEVRNLRSQFHDDAKTAFGRIGPSTEAYLNALDDVLVLLEGGGK